MYKIYPKLVNGEKPKFGFEKRVAFSSFKMEAVKKWLKEQANEDDWEIIYDKDYDNGCNFFNFPDYVIPANKNASKLFWRR